MQEQPEFWDGHPLAPGPVGLIIYQGQGEAKNLALGAAGSLARQVLLSQAHLAAFLAKHASADFVCYGAADLHWFLHDYFRGRDEAALATLWALSRESRLIDVAILDQLMRQIRGHDCTRRRPLKDLAEEAGIDLPVDAQVNQKVVTALGQLCRAESREALLVALQAVAAIKHVFRKLAGEAEKVLLVAEQASQPPCYQHGTLPAEVQKELAAKTRQFIAALQAQRALSSGTESDDRKSLAGGRVLSSEQDNAVHARRVFGLLGVGLEVQAAIVAGWLARQNLQVTGPARWQEVRRAGEERFAQVSARLYQDHEMPALFKWEVANAKDNCLRVLHDPATGNIVNAGKPFRDWLRDKVPDEIRDVHGCPTLGPFPAEDEPVEDPEHWGPLAAAHPRLRDWRDLVRSAQVAALPDIDSSAGAVRVSYATMPILRAAQPLLTAIREIAGPVFRPRDGHVFLVGTLEDLPTRCLVALCRLGGIIRRGTLNCRYFARRHGQPRELPLSPVEAVAADFVAMIDAVDLDAAEAALRERHQQQLPDQEEMPDQEAARRAHTPDEPRPIRPPTPVSSIESLIKHQGGRLTSSADVIPGSLPVDDEPDEPEDSTFTPTCSQSEEAYAQSQESLNSSWERFIQLREQQPEVHARWLRRVRDLLEALPLGLEGSRLRELLAVKDWWQGVSAAELDRYVGILKDRLATELAAFQNLDLINRLAEGLNRRTSSVVITFDNEDALPQLLYHLRQWCKSELVWRLIGVSRPKDVEGKQLGDAEVATRLLWWVSMTPAGRVVGPAFFAATRRELYLATIDEVTKAVAYALVAEGYPLVAVTDQQFVLEVPAGETSAEVEERLSAIVYKAQESLLGSLAAPCRWERVDTW